MGGTARVSVVVDAAWRVHVLVAELARARARRDLGRRPRSTATSASARRTPAALAAARRAPGCAARSSARRPGSSSTGPRLRLWVGGRRHARRPAGYAAAARAADEAVLGAGRGGAAPRSGCRRRCSARGPAARRYRIIGRRRLARLAELVGEPARRRPPAAASGPAAPAAPDLPGRLSCDTDAATCRRCTVSPSDACGAPGRVTVAARREPGCTVSPSGANARSSGALR